MSERILAGALLGAASAACFALASPFARLGLDNGITPADAVSARALVAMLFLSGLILLSKRSFAVPRPARGAIAGLGLSTALLSVAYLSSVAFIPVGVAVVIFFTFPLMIALLSPFIEKTPFGLARFAIGLVALAGLYLALGLHSSAIALDWRGVVLAGIGACAGVGQFFFGRAAAGQAGGPVIVWAAHLTIVPLTLLGSAVAAWLRGSVLSLDIITPTGYLVIVVICTGYLCGYLIQMQALRLARASYVAPAYNVEPVISTSVAAYLFSERLAYGQYLGGALVLAALILSNIISLRNHRAGDARA